MNLAAAIMSVLPLIAAQGSLIPSRPISGGGQLLQCPSPWPDMTVGLNQALDESQANTLCDCIESSLDSATESESALLTDLHNEENDLGPSELEVLSVVLGKILHSCLRELEESMGRVE